MSPFEGLLKDPTVLNPKDSSKGMVMWGIANILVFPSYKAYSVVRMTMIYGVCISVNGGVSREGCATNRATVSTFYHGPNVSHGATL